MTTGQILLTGLILAAIGFGLFAYLKHIISKQNELLLEKYEFNNRQLAEIFYKLFFDFQSGLNKNYEAFRNSIIEQTDKLGKETDDYTESVKKFTSVMNEFSAKTSDLIDVNKGFMRELKEISFTELTRTNESLAVTRDTFKDMEASFNKNSEAIIELLKGLNTVTQVFSQSEKNLSVITELNKNTDDLVRKFKEAVIQMELVSRSIASASENKVQPILDEMKNLLPSIREDASKVSSDLFARFSDSLDEMQKISIELNKISAQYNMLLSGNTRDPITGEFMQ
jgi:ABC-type transporter Mla subunit MlaD